MATTTTETELLKQQFESATLPCKSCNGTGITTYESFIAVDGTVYPKRERTCIWCDGAGHFDRPDLLELVKAIKGRKPGKLRSKRPDDSRAYFIWRMARFHTGDDVCLPMAAQMDVGADPYREMLELTAEIVAQRLTGHTSAGRARWRSAMYGEAPQERYRPQSAFPGGPVADANKPLEELLELI
jgi:hypothetical protein